MDNENLRKLIRYLGFYKKDFIIVMLSLSCVSCALLMIGRGFRQLVDSGLSEEYVSSVNQSISLISALIVILGVGSFFRSYFINNVAEKIINHIRTDVYSNLIHQEIFLFEEFKVGDIISCMTTDIELISKLIINFFSFFVRNFLMFIGGVTLMFLEDYKLALIVILIIPILLLPLIKFSKYVRNLSKKSLVSQSSIMSSIEESVTNIRAIHSFNQEENRIAEFQKQVSLHLSHSSSRFKIRALFFSVSMAMILIAIVVVIWIGSLDIINGSLSSGKMISFIYYSIIAGVSSGGIFEMLSEIHSPLAALERVFSIAKHSNISTLDQIDHYNNPVNGLKLENISFAYPFRPAVNVLNGISFTINPGQFIGIVGRSGAGKSTIMQLLLKFYYPTTGMIKIGDKDISQMETKIVRELIAYVPQEPAIFAGTIRSNIIFAHPSVSERVIMQVAEITGIMDFAQNLRGGIDATIGEKGVRLSGGQKQRIALARAMICNPEILLLDEAMSALDRESEQKLLKSIRQLMNGKIIVSIAHRIASIEIADDILVIDQGTVVARDTHHNLLAKSAIYRTICQEQLTITD